MSTFKELYQEHNDKFIKTNHLQRAYKSALYREKWKSEKVAIDKLQGIDSLKSIPYSNANDLRNTWENYAIEDIILTKSVALWFTTSGSMGNKKWMGWTYNDVSSSKEELGRSVLSIFTQEDRIMAILLPSPFISGTIPYRILESTGSMGTPIEQIIMSPDTVEDSFRLLMRRQPTGFICTPSFALRLAEEINRNAPRILDRMAKEQKSAKLKIASVVTKLTTVKPKQVFKNLRIGIFTSESLGPYRKAIEDLYGLEAFDLYGFTEGFGAGLECKEHKGLHFPSLNSVLEIIPQEELDKEAKDPSYHPETILLPDAKKGLKGELVVTDFKEAIPLIRYRVNDLVEVLDIDECSCGRNSPKMKVLGRSDDIINLGVIRFSTIIFDNLLQRDDFKNGKVDFWDLYITRDGFKPKLTLTIQIKEVSNEEQFKKELFESLCSSDIFKRGYDNELFLFDKIKLVDKLKLEIIGQGKRRKIRYDPKFFESVKL
ncbi:MAG: phenylacetate--CoA ligase family protein [Asgard group archaeon]|nr:phenylacetate--CoA ligase family protein [Asgard group archaeon]